MTPYVVLVVEDDAAIRRALVDALHFADYEVLDCCTGEEAVEVATAARADVVLLDVMLPGIDGFEVLDTLRRRVPTLPVIMVTARGSEEDRVRGLTDGADDYVVKPFSAKELLARVDAVLRRSPPRRESVRRLIAEDLTVDFEQRVVTWNDGNSRSLTEREAAILKYLSATGRIVNRNELLHRLWGYSPSGAETRTVDMHIARLREKIEKNPAEPEILLTVRGKGYCLADTVRTESS